MTPQSNIKKIIKEREKCFHPETHDILDEKTMDRLAVRIENLVKKHFDDLQVDFILDAMTHLGCCPQLIYDDNGWWSVTESAFSRVSLDDKPVDKFVGTVYIEGQEPWKESIREAVRYYIFYSE